MFPIEIKAGETINPDFFRGLRAFARRYHSPPPNGGAVVYGGTDYQQRNGTWVLPPERLPDLLAPLAAA